eukprot:TRINITY_DN242_c0_g1_i1.p1 TRINITY_DN242_c0_g1~~TRINITY_DN242_c0_g1_i1.p1  ORF type:complete len:413 (+),score=86.10 TRINITY_DN242_c0_g1_i1:116-1354(+)
MMASMACHIQIRTPISSVTSQCQSASPLKSAGTSSVAVSLQEFQGLKATASATLRFSNEVRLVSRKASNASPSPRRQQEGLRVIAGFNVAVLGAGGGIGQPLSMLMKMSPFISNLHLYDIANVKGVAADLSHVNTPAQVKGFTGPDELAAALDKVDLVIIPAGIPRKPGMTRDDLFNINAGIVKTLVEAVADYCPKAFITIISNPVNSTVPIAAEVLKAKSVFDPKKLFGVTTLDVVRANTFVAEKTNTKPIDVDIPVIGGHAGITILPLLSKATPTPKPEFSQEDIEALTVRIQNAGTEVVEAKAGAGSATLSMAYAAARFAESCLRALDGDADVFECSFVASEVTELPFFASRVKIGKNGVEDFVKAEMEGLTEYEQAGLEALKAELKGSIEKGIAFVASKNAEAAAAPA